MLPKTAPTDVYTDLKGLENLKRQARSSSPQAVKQVAKQFESLFVQMMLKSMREGSSGGGIMDNEQTKVYQDLHDKQLALQMSERKGIGLAELLAKQLGERSGPESPQINHSLDYYRQHPVFQSYPGARSKLDAIKPAGQSGNTEKILKNISDRPIKSQEEFVERLLPHARGAAAELGVAPEVLVAQAALETGWGRSVLKRSNGESSHNLFNIKAGRRWQGDRTSVNALEFEGGAMQMRRSSFRAYSDFGESFRDYVDFLKRNPRYENALRHAQNPRLYMHALQDAGYATDPRYADKVMRIVQKIRMTVASADQGGGNRVD